MLESITSTAFTAVEVPGGGELISLIGSYELLPYVPSSPY